MQDCRLDHYFQNVHVAVTSSKCLLARRSVKICTGVERLIPLPRETQRRIELDVSFGGILSKCPCLKLRNVLKQRESRILVLAQWSPVENLLLGIMH